MSGMTTASEVFRMPQIARTHLAEVIKLSGLLGLSPSSCTRIEVYPEGKREDELLV